MKQEQIPPPGAYIVENYTIAKNVKAESEEDPDLAIKKPPFNTGVARFKEKPSKGICFPFKNSHRRG
jgi:hypothetical protein